MTTDEKMEALLNEGRVFPPPDRFAATANANNKSLYEMAENDYEAFWAKQAEELHWFRRWDKVLEWTVPFSKWFVGGKTNICYNCLDRHVKGPLRNKAAIIWEGEAPEQQRVLTYWDLYREVNKFADVLKNQLNVEKGDRVTIYMPMIPELVIVMLAVVRIGAVHSIIFGGFSPESIKDRVLDSQSKVVVTADGGYRNGQVIQLKRNVDEALAGNDTPVTDVVVVRNMQYHMDIEIDDKRDTWYHRAMRKAHHFIPAEEMDSEDLSFLLYTSGTTGKPKGIMHTTGGYLTGVHYSTKYVFDLKPEDVFWCTADIGWITGHSYITYGPLSNGATVVMYEGSPGYPDKDRFWHIIEKYGVSIFYTAPTAIRTFMRWGEKYPQRRNLSSLRLLGTVGEPINPEAWMWYYKNIGHERCPIVDTWWQTETGSIIVAPLPGVIPVKPGSATIPLPGYDVAVVDKDGHPVKRGEGGLLVIRKPWPSMLRGIYGDPDRYYETYWKKFGNLYFTGDGAKIDRDSYLWLLGRVDDVINVSGHRIGTMEVESACVDFPAVSEAAVIGIPHEIKGQAIVAFVTIKDGEAHSLDLIQEIEEHVVAKIGSIARLEKIFITAELPKTRSGKIMRRLLRDIANGNVIGDTTTLADPVIVEQLKQRYESEEGN